MTIKLRDQVILAKAETGYGTDPTPTGAANAMLATDVTLQPMQGQDVSRALVRPWLGNQGTIVAGHHAVLSFTTELAGSGSTGVAPAWSPLARACGLAEIVTPDDDPGDGTVVYAPASDDHESVTVYFWYAATRQVIVGARGTAVIEIGAQGIPRLRWTLTGLWAKPTEAAQAVPSFAAFKKPLIATSAHTPVFTIDAVPLVLRNFSLDLGNQVEQRLLIGSESIEIVDRAEAIAATVEAVPLSTLDPFDLAEKGDEELVEVEIVHGIVPGNIVAINAPACQMQRLSGYGGEQGKLEWPLRLAPQPDEGDDQFEIVLT